MLTLGQWTFILLIFAGALPKGAGQVYNMKRITLLIATLLAAFSFTSCDKENGKDNPKDDPVIDYPYSYYEPCMMWGEAKEEVMQFMSSTYPSWTLDAGSSSDNEIFYLDGKYKAINMSYTFEDGKLESSAIAYPLQSDSFDKFKSDIEGRYKVELEFQGVYSGTELYFAHSDAKNMDINLTNSNSKDMFYTIMASFTGTGPAPSDEIKFDITPSNKATLNFTDLMSILLTFPEAKEVSLYNDIFKNETFSLVDSEGNTIWEIGASSSLVSCAGNEINVQVPIYLYDNLTAEGDYTLVITPNTILVDGKMLPEQHITYHLTANHPVLEPFELNFDSKVTNTEELHFYIPDGIEAVGCAFYGGTPIYDEDNNDAGEVYNFGQIDDNHFFLTLRMTATDQSKTYHFDLAEGLITGRTAFGDIPSAATSVTFCL